MNIPTTLADELKLYLKQQAKNGDLEAQTLLAQIEPYFSGDLENLSPNLSPALE